MWICLIWYMSMTVSATAAVESILKGYLPCLNFFPQQEILKN